MKSLALWDHFCYLNEQVVKNHVLVPLTLRNSFPVEADYGYTDSCVISTLKLDHYRLL